MQWPPFLIGSNARSGAAGLAVALAGGREEGVGKLAPKASSFGF